MISIHLYLVCIYYNLLEFWKLCTSTYTEFSYESLRITPNRKGTRILAIWSVLLSCESFTSYLRINQSVDKHKKKIDRVNLRISANYLQMLTIDNELVIRTD